MKRIKSLLLLSIFLGSWLAFAEEGGAPETKAQADPRFYYPSDPEYLVLRFSASGRDQKLLRIDIYGNGRVLFHRPHGYIDPGSYEIEISNQELEELLTFLADRGIMSMTSQDVEAFKRKAMAEAATEGIMPGTSSEAHHTIRVHLDGYVSRDGRAFDKIDREMSFGPIDHIVRFYPQAVGLRRLDEVVKKFMTLQLRYRLALKDRE